jgi:hypothetical protein
MTMSNDLTAHEPEPEDDGFYGSLNSGRLIKGTFLKWNDTAHWHDRDGLTPPSPLLVIAINELLQMWKNGKAEIISERPLPDPGMLNAAIPVSEWEIGLDNKPQKPWNHTIVIYFVNLATGEFFTYASPTTGAHIAYDALKEAVVVMRALRGIRVMPIVNLGERPMKTKFGMKRRPHLEITSWKTPGDDAKAVPAKPAAPQLSAGAAPTETPSAPAAAVSPATPAAASNPRQPHQAKPKPAVNLATETLAAMSDVKPVTLGEVLDDELPY